MSDSKANIFFGRNEWVDLYALAGISVGTPIAVENIGDVDVYLTVLVSQPPPDHEAYNILRRDGPPLRNSIGDGGAWAFCRNSSAKLSIRILAL